MKYIYIRIAKSLTEEPEQNYKDYFVNTKPKPKAKTEFKNKSAEM